MWDWWGNIGRGIGKRREGKVGRAEYGKEGLAQRFRKIMMSDNTSHDVRRLTSHGGRGCVLPEDVYTKSGRKFEEVIWEKHPYMRVPPTRYSR